MPPVSLLSNRYGLPVSSTIKTLHANRRRDTLFSCFSKPPRNRRFPVLRPNLKCALWARNMSRWVYYASGQTCYANYERAICQEFAKSLPRCAWCSLLLVFPARSLWLIIIYCYQMPDFPCFALLKLYILLWFLRVFGILTFFKYDERVM